MTTKVKIVVFETVEGKDHRRAQNMGMAPTKKAEKCAILSETSKGLSSSISGPVRDESQKMVPAQMSTADHAAMRSQRGG